MAGVVTSLSWNGWFFAAFVILAFFLLIVIIDIVVVTWESSKRAPLIATPASDFQPRGLDRLTPAQGNCLVIFGLLLGIVLTVILGMKARETLIAKNELAENKPNLEGFIDQYMIWSEPGTTNTIILLQVSVNNSGRSPSLAENYKLKVVFTNNTSKDAKTLDISDQYTWSTLRSNTLTLYQLKRSDLLSEKTSIPVSAGGGSRGWLAYRLPGVQLDNNWRASCSLIVSFMDVSGKSLFVTNGLFKGKTATNYESVDIPKTMPGSVNLVETNIELQSSMDVANWEPPELDLGCTNIILIFGNQVINIPRWEAEVSPDDSVAKLAISELPDSMIKNLEKSPNYSPRLETIFARGGSMRTSFGDKEVTYPFCPSIESNRLYLYVQIPFENGLKKLIMNDTFDPFFPKPWDRNYGTNRYVYEVVNEHTNPVLQVFYTSPNEIHINAIFIIDTNNVLQAFWDAPKLIGVNCQTIDLDRLQDDTQIPFNGRIVQITDTNALGDVVTNTLYDMIASTNQPRMFQYPSNRKNMGVFAH